MYTLDFLAALPVCIVAQVWSYLWNAPESLLRTGTARWYLLSMLPPEVLLNVLEHLPARSIQALQRTCHALNRMVNHHRTRMRLLGDYEGPSALLLQPLTDLVYPCISHLEIGTLGDVLLQPHSEQPAGHSAQQQLAAQLPLDTSPPQGGGVQCLRHITHLTLQCHLGSPSVVATISQLIASCPALLSLTADLDLDDHSPPQEPHPSPNVALLTSLPTAAPNLLSLTIPHLPHPDTFSAGTLAALMSLTRLTRLHLNHCTPIPPHHAQALAAALLPLTNLRSLALPVPVATPLLSLLPPSSPPLAFLRLTSPSPALLPLPDLPAMPRPPPHSLHLHGGSLMAALTPHLPALTPLRHLTLANLRLTDLDLLPLAALCHLSSLAILPDLRQSPPFTAQHLTALAPSTPLRALLLFTTTYHPNVAAAIIRSPHLTRLVYHTIHPLPHHPQPHHPPSAASASTSAAVQHQHAPHAAAAMVQHQPPHLTLGAPAAAAAAPAGPSHPVTATITAAATTATSTHSGSPPPPAPPANILPSALQSLCHLRALHLSTMHAEAWAALATCAAPARAALQQLTLRGLQLPTGFPQPRMVLPLLSSLTITGTSAEAPTREALEAAVQLLPGLCTLRVDCAANMTDASLQQLCRSCRALRVLDLGLLRWVSDVGVLQLQELPRLSRLVLVFDRRAAAIHCEHLGAVLQPLLQHLVIDM